MAIKENKNGKYPVQISLTKKEYESIRKEAFKVDKTINKYMRDCVLEAIKK